MTRDSAVRAVTEFFQDQWFDRTRNVRTSGDMSSAASGITAGELADSEAYQPARPAHIRQALHEISVADVSGYSYVDLGSGKGRTLFIAAELPFREIVGVEFSRLLYEKACANIRSFRFWKVRCRNIQSLHANAKDFAFPENKLVLYLFNPFGYDTMQQVVRNLEASLRRNPRHVIVILLWPQQSELIARIDGMCLRRKTRQYQIFEVHGPDHRKAAWLQVGQTTPGDSSRQLR